MTNLLVNYDFIIVVILRSKYKNFIKINEWR